MNYQKGQIYKLVNDQLNLTYFGSTCSPLHKRLYAHKQKLTKCSSKILFQEGSDVKIYLVEEYPVVSRQQLKQRERHYVETNLCVNK